jgi:hypothetical protein
MTSYDVPPNGRVLWCLRRRRTDVRCVIVGGSVPVEMRILHDRDVVVTEFFEEERFALGWARSYELRLRDRGWSDSPVSKAS